MNGPAMKIKAVLINPISVFTYIVFIGVILVFGSLYLYGQINILKKDIPGIILSERNTVAESLSLFNNLREDVVNPAFSWGMEAALPENKQTIDERISSAVRVISHSANVLSVLERKLPSEQTREVRDILVDLAQTGEQALKSHADMRKDKAIAFLEKIDAAYAPLSEFIRQKSIAQIASSTEQKELLERTTFGAAVLLGVFALFATATGLLLRAELVSQERTTAAERRASFLAYHDPLTGLANRTLLSEKAPAINNKEPSSILFLIDLDEFKAVNDSFGHSIGDALLVEIAERIKNFVSNYQGMAARLDGDEFAAIIPWKEGTQSVSAISSDLMSKITGQFHTDDAVLVPHASIGAVIRGLASKITLSEMLTNADLALREAKRQGRNRFIVYQDALAEKARYRREIKNAVPDALRADEFELHFQPQILLKSGRLCGFEALVRWRRQGKLLPPGEFIPILEETGLVRLVDLWVMRKAAQEAAAWLRQKRDPLTVSVNLSTRHFQFDDIVSYTQKVLAETGLPPHLLTLEITESALMEHWDRSTRIISELSALGVKISLDDFGTGYSSLAYLRTLKVNELKIDRAFVTDIETSDETRVILSSVVDIARGLGMGIVVEGIETIAQRDIARGLGAQTGQGYLFGAPMPRERTNDVISEEAMAVIDWNEKVQADAKPIPFKIA